MIETSGIYGNVEEDSVPSKKQIRAWGARVDNPINDIPTINYRIERVFLNYNNNVVYREDRRKIKDVSIKFSEIATKQLDFIDTFTKQEIHMSDEDVVEIISIFFAKVCDKDF